MTSTRLILSRPISRSFFTTTSSQAYRINYDDLRGGKEAMIREIEPETVEGNVKKVTGWRGGAKRGFLAAYPDCIHVLTSEGMKNMPDITNWYRKVLTYNLSSSVLKQRYGILVPITYRQLRPEASKEDMNLAHVLGWCVELIRAAAIVATDTVALQSKVRYGLRKDAEIVPWARKHNLGNKAFNDALLIERGVFVLLKHYFGKKATLYYEPITHAQRSRAMGRSFGYSLTNYEGHLEHKESRLADYTYKNYKALTRSHVSRTNYCLPVSLAMNLAGLEDPKLHDLAHGILHEMGYFYEATRDYGFGFEHDCGSDIQDGRLTWLIVLALQHANPEQRALLEANYGCGPTEPEKSKLVQQIYANLHLKHQMQAFLDEKKGDIVSRIQGISKLDKAGLSQEFFFKLMDNMDANDIH